MSKQAPTPQLWFQQLRLLLLLPPLVSSVLLLL
jgi:hypothetical protein